MIDKMKIVIITIISLGVGILAYFVSRFIKHESNKAILFDEQEFEEDIKRYEKQLADEISLYKYIEPSADKSARIKSRAIKALRKSRDYRRNRKPN